MCIFFGIESVCPPLVKRETNIKADITNVSGTVTSLMTTISQLKISGNKNLCTE